MPTRDLAALQENGGLTYPGIKSPAHPDGRDYRVPSPSADDGLYLARLGELGLRSALANGALTEADAKELELDDRQERDLYRLALGSALEEMKTDGVPWEMLRHIGQDAFTYWATSPDFADVVLAAKGEAVARTNRATRRAEARATKRTSPNTAGSSSNAASTPTRARTRSAPATTRGTGPSSTSPNEPKAAAAAG